MNETKPAPTACGGDDLDEMTEEAWEAAVEEEGQQYTALEELAALPLDAPERPALLGWLLGSSDSGADILDMEYGRAIQEYRQSRCPSPWRDAVASPTTMPDLFQYSHAPVAGMALDQRLGRIMLFNPHTLVAVALDLPPEWKEAFRGITGAGIAAARRRYGQERMARLFGALALSPANWAALEQEAAADEAAHSA